jgi:hypothetical protein
MTFLNFPGLDQKVYVQFVVALTNDPRGCKEMMIDFRSIEEAETKLKQFGDKITCVEFNFRAASGYSQSAVEMRKKFNVRLRVDIDATETFATWIEIRKWELDIADICFHSKAEDDLARAAINKLSQLLTSQN